MITLYDSEQSVREEVQEIFDRLGERETRDAISDIADRSCPTETASILQIAAENVEFALDGPLWTVDSKRNPIDMIVANIYNHLVEVAYVYLSKLVREKEELDNHFGTFVGESLVDVIDEDWLNYRPVIDRDGVIVDVLESDTISGDEIFVYWTSEGPIITDDSIEFDAVLESPNEEEESND